MKNFMPANLQLDEQTLWKTPMLARYKWSNLKKLVSIINIEFVVNCLFTKRTSSLNDSAGQFYQTLKEEIIPILYKH